MVNKVYGDGDDDDDDDDDDVEILFTDTSRTRRSTHPFVSKATLLSYSLSSTEFIVSSVANLRTASI